MTSFASAYIYKLSDSFCHIGSMMKVYSVSDDQGALVIMRG